MDMECTSEQINSECTTQVLDLNMNFLSAYYRVVKAKSTYLNVLIRNNMFVLFVATQETFRMTYGEYPNDDNLILRLPIETTSALFFEGKLEITRRTKHDKPVLDLVAIDSEGKVKANATIIEEICDTESQMSEIMNSIGDNKSIVVTDISLFKNALQLTKPSCKDTPIKGVYFTGGTCYTLANGYAAYMKDPFNLNVVIATSSLVYLVDFVAGAPEVRITRSGGYNLCIAGKDILGWRRVRPSAPFDVSTAKFDTHLTLPAKRINNVLSCLKTEVSSCILKPSLGILDIITQIGSYQIPIFEPVEDISDIQLKYKLFSVLIKGLRSTHVTLNLSETTLELIDGDLHYFIGVAVYD